MKFLANENLPMGVIMELRKLGHDILRVDEVKKGMKDLDVLNLSAKEKRILITFDKDFGELVVKEGKKSNGVILLRIHPESLNLIKDNLIKVFEKVFDLENKFIIIEENKIRERSLK